MATFGVVIGQVPGEGRGAVRGARVGLGIGPFVEQRANEAFRFAVGLGAIGARPAVFDAGASHHVLDIVPEIAGAVVGENAPDADAELGEVQQRAQEKRRGRGPVFAREDFRVRNACAVIDRDVHVLPADARTASASIAVNAMADAANLPELLDVEMHEVARALVLVAHDRSRRLERVEMREPQPALFSDDVRERNAVVLRNADRAPPLATPTRNLPTLMPRHPSRTAMRSRRPIRDAPLPLGGKAPTPFVDRRAGDPKLTSQGRDVRAGKIGTAAQLPSP